MADDILIKVKEAEQMANKSVADAREKSSLIIKEAKNTADSEYKRIIAEANSQAKSLLDQAHEDALREKEPIINEAKSRANKTKSYDKANVKNIVEKLTERIVRDGNS